MNSTNDDTLLDHAAYARTIVARSRVGSLATISSKHEGCPYGSLVQHVIDDDGAPLFLTSTLAAHTRNFLADPRASLFINDRLMGTGDLMNEGRVCLMGKVERVDVSDPIRAAMLRVHPGSSRYIDFGDFSFYRLAVEHVRYIAGFGRMSWVTAPQYVNAAPDPLAHAAVGIVTHMNDDHADTLPVYCAAFGGSPNLDEGELRMSWVDRFGFDVAHVTTGKGWRFGFEEVCETPAMVRKALVKMVREGRERLG